MELQNLYQPMHPSEKSKFHHIFNSNLLLRSISCVVPRGSPKVEGNHNTDVLQT